jgi:Transposase DDE domain
MEYCTKNMMRSSIRTHRNQFVHSEDGFKALMNHSCVKSILEQSMPDHRERIFTPTFTLHVFNNQVMSANKSCRGALIESLPEFVIRTGTAFSTNTGAYCKARRRLPESLITDLAKSSGEYLQGIIPEDIKWTGREVKLVDGTTVSMPDTPENQKSYPQNPTQEKGLGFPIARLAAIISLSTGAVLDLAIGDYYSSEHGLLREMLGGLSGGDILLGDEYYCSYFLLAQLQRKKIDAVFKIKWNRKVDFRRGKRIGEDDHIIYWEKGQRPKWMDKASYDELPPILYMREIKKGKKIIVTTLLNSQKYSKKELMALYDQRWQVELDLRAIKSVMGMSILRCKTPDMIRKEIWMYMLVYNLVRLFILQSALIFKISPRNLSFITALQAISQFYWVIKFIKNKNMQQKLYQILLISLAENKVGNRPGRREPREIKRRPKTYKLLLKPRKKARKRLLARA